MMHSHSGSPLVRGEGRFVDDLDQLVFVRSHERLFACARRALRRVLLTAAESGRAQPLPVAAEGVCSPISRIRKLASDEVRYAGQPVAGGAPSTRPRSSTSRLGV